MLNYPKIFNLLFKIFLTLMLTLTAVNSFSHSQSGMVEANNGSQQPTQAINSEPVPGGPGYLMLGASAFSPSNNYLVYSWGRGDNGIFVSGNTENTLFHAPAYLPQGARINKFTLYYYDGDPDQRLAAHLERKDVTNSVAAQNIAGAASPISADGYNNVSDNFMEPGTDIVDNQTYAYFVEAVFYEGVGTDVRLLGVRIDYSFDTYLSLIQK